MILAWKTENDLGGKKFKDEKLEALLHEYCCQIQEEYLGVTPAASLSKQIRCHFSKTIRHVRNTAWTLKKFVSASLWWKMDSLQQPFTQRVHRERREGLPTNAIKKLSNLAQKLIQIYIKLLNFNELYKFLFLYVSCFNFWQNLNNVVKYFKQLFSKV